MMINSYTLAHTDVAYFIKMSKLLAFDVINGKEHFGEHSYYLRKSRYFIYADSTYNYFYYM